MKSQCSIFAYAPQYSYGLDQFSEVTPAIVVSLVGGKSKDPHRKIPYCCTPQSYQPLFQLVVASMKPQTSSAQVAGQVPAPGINVPGNHTFQVCMYYVPGKPSTLVGAMRIFSFFAAQILSYLQRVTQKSDAFATPAQNYAKHPIFTKS